MHMYTHVVGVHFLRLFLFILSIKHLCFFFQYYFMSSPFFPFIYVSLLVCPQFQSYPPWNAQLKKEKQLVVNPMAVIGAIVWRVRGHMIYWPTSEWFYIFLWHASFVAYSQNIRGLDKLLFGKQKRDRGFSNGNRFDLKS